MQITRSAIFAAARAGYAEKVMTGIWENGMDAAGGEIRPGCEDFVQSSPQDLKQTLLHIATKHGDGSLVEWLDTHSKVTLPYWLTGVNTSVQMPTWKNAIRWV
jgi:hypothetical protein